MMKEFAALCAAKMPWSMRINVVLGLARHALCSGATAVLLVGCGPSGFSPPGATVPGAMERSTGQTHGIPQWQTQNLARLACPVAGPSEAQCQLLILNQSKVKEPGWGARDIEAAYNLPSSSEG